MTSRSTDPTPARERILRAAREISRDRGYKGTTLAMIQKAAGVHPGSFYWHFEDKDALFAGVVRHEYQESRPLVDRLGPGDAVNPVKVVLDSVVNNPARFGLWRFNVQLMLDPDMQDSRTAQEIRNLRVITRKALTRAWLEHMPEPVLQEWPELPVRLAEFALATVEGCILSRVAGMPRDEEFITALATSTLDQVVAAACAEVGEPVPEFFRQRAGIFRPGLVGTAAPEPFDAAGGGA